MPADGTLDPLSIMFALGAAAGWAAYILLGGTAGATFGKTAAALSVSIAGLLILPVGVMNAGTALLGPELLPLALLVALLSAALPFSLELYALQRLPARTFAVFTSLEQRSQCLPGLFILDEKLAWPQIAGVVMVMIAAAGAACSIAKLPMEQPILASSAALPGSSPIRRTRSEGPR